MSQTEEPSNFEHLDFGIVSDFDIRISNFRFKYTIHLFSCQDLNISSTNPRSLSSHGVAYKRMILFWCGFCKYPGRLSLQ